ncbi:MAG TPA: citrate/2-methylcitrate synthase, partial [Methylomirabilota bacterium]|nr:citrate/2-methylcitrate synthase [Methylomirabilota bacterium]
MSDAKPGAKNSVTLTDNRTGRSWEFPVIDGSIGPSVIDIRKLYGETDMFTYDPGFTSTGACESKITFIDGEAGILRHRGYAIEDLAEHSDFMEVCYLLLHGDLPDTAQKAKFVHDITHHTMVHEQIQFLFRGFRRDAHP